MNFQMIRVISSPSISTTGFFTLIFAIVPIPFAPQNTNAGAVLAKRGRPGKAACRRSPPTSDPIQSLFAADVPRHRGDLGQKILEIADEGQVVEVASFGETAFHDPAQQRCQGPPKAALVDDHDRLGVQAERPPGQDFEQLFQGADPARQHDKGVRAFEHLQLALVHGLHDDGLGQGRMAGFALQQKPRNDACDPAAALEGGISEQAHQTDPTAAINERYVFTGQQFAQPDGNIPRRRIDAKTGATEDTKRRWDGNGHGCFYLQVIRCLSGPGRHGIISQREVATPRAVGRRTIGRVMSRTVLWLMAAGAIVFAAAVGVAWHGMRSDQAFLDQSARPGANVASAPALQPPSPSGEASPPKAAPPAVAVPTFDVARIGPDGRAVIAGRAQPGAKIVLLDGGKEIAQGQADANGEWVVLAQDPPMGAGQHELRVIQHVQGRAPVTSDQVVVAIVPDQKPPATSTGPKEETLVMIAPSSGAPTLVQPPSAAGVQKSGDLVMSTLDYDESGHVTVTGKATPGAVVRAYINDKMVAEGKTGGDGSWRLAPSDPVDVG